MWKSFSSKSGQRGCAQAQFYSPAKVIITNVITIKKLAIAHLSNTQHYSKPTSPDWVQ